MNLQRILGLLLGTLLTLSLLSAIPETATAVKPKNDSPRLPRVCATAKEQIPRKFIFCQLNRFQPDRRTVFLWGDSHAYMMVPALKRAVRNEDVNLIAFMLGGCPPMLPTDKNGKRRKSRNGCEEAGELVLGNLKSLQKSAYPPKVILGLNWDMYLTGLENLRRGKPAYNAYIAQTSRSFRRGTPKLFRVLGRMGVDADVLAPIAQVPESTRRCRAGNLPYRCNLARFRVLHKEKSRFRHARRNTRVLAGNPRLIDVNGAFCNARRCRGRVGRTLTWYDDLHISATMARRRMAGFFTDSVADAT